MKKTSIKLDDLDRKNLDQVQAILTDIIKGRKVSLTDYPNVIDYRLTLADLDYWKVK